MTTKINELAKQAGQGSNFHIPPEFIQQFSDLLIKEAIHVVKTTGNQCAVTTYDLGVVSCTLIKTQEALEQHFKN